MNNKDLELIIAALEVVYQIEGLGFSDEERDRAVDIIELLEGQPDELHLN